MTIHYEKGDIFQIGPDEGYDFMLVFGHIGFNDMANKWNGFKIRFPKFASVEDPFNHYGGPITYSSGKWIQFVPEEKNHGIALGHLREIFDRTFGWAAKAGLKSVITNGVRDTDHERVNSENRASDDRRVRHIDELVRLHIESFRSIKLISLNDAFTRNFRSDAQG